MLGRNIGNYEVVSKLGEGGMGVVYMARHTTLGRLAAVKVLLPEYSNNREIVSRFFNEARAATAIRNPGIVEVYDFGFLEEKHAYIIMEYLEGENLGARLRRGPLPLSSVLAIARGIAKALHAAHEKGIVHRDLKPDNIFLIPDEEVRAGERVKLLDFGIAKLALDAVEGQRTRTGAVMGTPTYMSPEQCRGAGTTDHRSDLYSLGCVMFEMICGRPPFVAEGAGDIFAHHLYFQPQAPRMFRPDLPEPVEQLVLRLLEKDPAARPVGASHVVSSIDALQTLPPAPPSAASLPMVAFQPASQPTTLSSATASSITAPRSRRGLVIGGGVVAMLALIAIIAVVARSNNESPEVARGEPDAPIKATQPAPSPSPSPPPPSSPPAQPPTVDANVVVAPTIDAAVVEAPKPPPPVTNVGSASKPPKQPSKPSGKVDPPKVDPPKDPPKPPDKPKPNPACSVASFQAVLDEPSLEEAQVQSALARLKSCKSVLGDSVFSDIQRKLIGRL